MRLENLKGAPLMACGGTTARISTGIRLGFERKNRRSATGAWEREGQGDTVKFDRRKKISRDAE